MYVKNCADGSIAQLIRIYTHTERKIFKSTHTIT